MYLSIIVLIEYAIRPLFDGYRCCLEECNRQSRLLKRALYVWTLAKSKVVLSCEENTPPMMGNTFNGFVVTSIFWWAESVARKHNSMVAAATAFAAFMHFHPCICGRCCDVYGDQWEKPRAIAAG